MKLLKWGNNMKYKAQQKYDEKNTVKFGIKLNKKTDNSIINWLQSSENKQGLIKLALKTYFEQNVKNT